MTLDKLIKRIKARKMGDADFEHPLALAIHEELEQCKRNKQQGKLFNDARKLSDDIIEQYVTLDREDKLKMVEVYQQEKCFKNLGGFQGNKKSCLSRKIGKSNSALLIKISNYSKLIPILESYIKYIEENEDNLNNRNSDLTNYLLNHNKEGKKVKNQSKESMGNFYKYDFRNNRCFKSRERNNKSILESMIYRLPEELKQRVIDAQALIKLRTKVIENYLKYIEKNEDNLKNTNSSLIYYLNNHDAKGKKVRKISKESMRSFYKFDFRNNKIFKPGETNDSSILESMTFRVPEELKQKVTDSQSITNLRTKILENYLKYIKENKGNLKNNNSTLTYYLSNHDAKGKKVKQKSKESMVSFYTYDFKNNRQFKKGERNDSSILESMTFRVPEELKQKVRDEQTRTNLRIEILENYLKYIEENEDNLKNHNSCLNNYLNQYNVKGKKVRKISKESMRSFYGYDFRNNKGFKKGELNHHNILESMTYKVPEELKQKVIDAQSRTNLRTKVIENYLIYTKKEAKLGNRVNKLFHYLDSHDKKGKKVKYQSKESMHFFYVYDFRNNRTFKSRERNSNSLFESMTYRIKDQALIEKVKKYHFGEK